MTVVATTDPPGRGRSTVPAPDLTRIKAEPAPGRSSAGPRTSGRGLAFSARVRIMGWLMLLLAVVMGTAIVVTRNLLLQDVGVRVNRALTQEAEEFKQFALVGRDPQTGRPFAGASALLTVYLQRQFPDSDEVLFGATMAGEILRHAAEPRYDVSADGDARRRIIEAAGASGSLDTPAGPMRWAKVRMMAPGSDQLAGWLVVGHFTGPSTAKVADTVQTMLLVSLLGLVLAGVAAWVVAGQILAPVRLVRQAAAEISEHDLTRRIPVRGRDDVAALAEQFNSMLDRLEQAFGTQRQFLDDASHELRTPITIVRGHLELMGDDPAERACVVRLCTEELDRMNRIVSDLLLLAKSRRPDFLRVETVELAELTSDLHAKLRALGPRRWRLETVGEGSITVDPQRITQAVEQLAHNAVQHTNDGEEILLGSALQDGAVSFWITDHGPGVSPDDAQVIFERFARGSTGGGHGQHTGAGLGLAIVRVIADAHGGRVVLVSTRGVGATFGLELPAGGHRP